jgi:hypothetical protein
LAGTAVDGEEFHGDYPIAEILNIYRGKA